MEAQAAPSVEAWRACVLAAICPICGRGPFVVLALHTRRKHAIDKRELRARAGFFYGDSICDPAHSERMSELAKDRGIATHRVPKDQQRPRRPRVMTPAAKVQNREKLRQYAESVGTEGVREQRRAAARKMVRGRVLIRTCHGTDCCNLILGTAQGNCSDVCVQSSIARRGFATTGPPKQSREARQP